MLFYVLGDVNFKVNVSVELIGEIFYMDLMIVVLELFNNKLYWIEV